VTEPNLDRWSREMVERSRGSIWSGLGLTLLFHFVTQVPTIFILGVALRGERAITLTFLPLMFIGLSQLAYVIPAILVARRKGESETSKGLIIGASLTFLLNAACTGPLLLSGNLLDIF